MNALSRFQRLASQARGELIPTIDVAARVVRDLQSGIPRPGGETTGPLWLASGLSVAAASIVAVLAIESWERLTDPLSGLLYPLTLVMQ